MTASRPLDRRVTRRGVLRSAVAGAAALGAAAALRCDDGDDGGGVATPRRGGTLRFGTTLPMTFGLDPHLEQGSGLPIVARLYGYLLHVDPRDERVVLDHAASAEQPEATTYVVRLGEHRFHDATPANGRAVTAHDVAASIGRYRDSALVTDNAWHRTVLGGFGAPDDRTLLVTTNAPYASTLAEIGHINAGAILPREAVQQAMDLRATACGSGPFALERMGFADTRARRFEQYAPEPALMDAMEWRIFGNESEKLAAFRDRAVDVIPVRRPRDLDLPAAVEGGEIAVTPEQSLASIALGFRMDRPPFADERVRRAVDLAIDRETLIRELSIPGGRICGPVSPHLAGGFWALPDDEVGSAQGADLPVEERIAEAGRLLDAAGARGARFSLQVADLPELLDVAAVLRTRLQGVDLAPQVAAMPLISWYANFRSGAFDATLISWPPHETPAPALRAYHSAGPAGAGNAFGLRDAAIDARIERAWRESDRELRREAVLDAQRLLVNARPCVHLFTGTSYTASWARVRDGGFDLPGSLARYHYRHWLSADD